MTYYVLVGHEPMATTDLAEFSRGMEIDKRRVGYTELGDEVHVSTVFLGIDNSFGGAKPVLFETMVFGGEHDQWQWRYETWDQAQAGHDEVVAALHDGKPLDEIVAGWLA